MEEWSDDFDWRAQERRLNAMPQFLMSIDDVTVHFVHIKSGDPNAIPLLMTHGWPGSFAEFAGVVPHLVGTADVSFDLVIPSIPGFGFSSIPIKPGMSQRRVAQMWLEVMAHLGYERFGLQGGDFGAGISAWMARLAPEAVVGMHLNFLPGSYAPHIDESKPLQESERNFFDRVHEWREAEGAYGHLHRTRPQSLAYGLNDSPIGLAGWLVEKYYAWADNGAQLQPVLPRSEILTALSLYWFTGTIGSSMRFYLESGQTPLRLAPGETIAVPLSFARFPKETVSPPREWIERGFNLVRFNDVSSGGHFAAWENPVEFAADVRAFFAELRERDFVWVNASRK